MTTRRNFLGSVFALFAAPAVLLKERVRFTHGETMYKNVALPVEEETYAPASWHTRPVTLNDVAARSGGDVQEAMAAMLREQRFTRSTYELHKSGKAATITEQRGPTPNGPWHDYRTITTSL